MSEPVELHYDHHAAALDEVYATYDKLRAGCPVGHTEAHGGYYVIGSHADALAGARDWKTFSSADGTRLPKAPFRIAAIEFDPPEHTYWRDLYREVMNLSTYRSFEQRIADHVKNLVAGFSSAGRADLYEQLAEPLPVITVCEVIGLTDRRRQLEVRQVALNLYQAQGDPAAFRSALERFQAFCLRELADRREAPHDDFLTRLATKPVEGEPMPDDKILNLLIGFLVAGHHSPASALAKWVKMPSTTTLGRASRARVNSTTPAGGSQSRPRRLMPVSTLMCRRAVVLRETAARENGSYGARAKGGI